MGGCPVLFCAGTRHLKTKAQTEEKHLQTNWSVIKICETPPPMLPQPAAVALAVPITFGANMREHQNWFVTKAAPTIPMKKRNSV